MKKIFGIMFAVGLALLCVAGYLTYSTHQFQSVAIHAEGKITDLRYSRGDNSSSGVWYPEVTFTDDSGKNIVFESSVGSSGYRNSLGDTVSVIYKQGDSKNAQINSNVGLYLGALICGSFALVLLFIGGIGSKLMNNGSRHSHLMQTGKPLTASIVDVELNESIQFNGRSPWRIVCQWLDPQSSQVYLFNSANFYYDPTPFIKNKNITVYVAKDNLKKYYVDISRFPKKA